MPSPQPDDGFGQYYKANVRRVGGRAFLLTGNRTDAEDISQDAFVALYRQWPQAQAWDDKRRNSYVGQTLCNLAAELVRRQIRQRTVADRLAHHREQVIHIEDDVMNRLIARGGEVSAILGRLSAMERLVLVLLEVEDLPVRKIALMLEISESTVRTYLQRARDKLEVYRSAERVSSAGARTAS
jgi:RNA polymerase sigma factor (sigma-70 family)